MTKIVSLLFLATLLLSSASGQTTFKIEGKVQGYSNGTKLYLHDLSDGSYKQVDSTIIVDDKFIFTGDLKRAFIRSAISNTDLSDRTSFWLESGTMSFSAEKGNFRKAVIKGSKIQDDQNRLNKLVDTAKNKQEVEYLFVKENPGSVVSANLLSVYCSSWKKDKVVALYNSFSKEVKSTDYGKKVSDYISLNRDVKVGDKFVDFAQNDSSNKSVKLSDFSGKVVLLEFWGSWCGPCREQNPSLVKIYSEFKVKGFEILGVGAETDRRKWIEAINKDGLTWINVTDLKGDNNKAAMIYGISGYPTNFLIDKNGTIIAKDVYGEKLRDLIAKHL